MKLFAGNAVWQLLAQSDWVSWAVIIILFVLSIICWSIALYKFQIINKKNKQIQQLLLRLSSVTSLEQLVAVGQTVAHTLPGMMITRTLARVQTLLGGRTQLAPEALDVVHAELNSLLDEIMHAEEQQLPTLKTAAEVGPLLGLFGTIWGLIHAFVRISHEQNADIVTVAPGIAEALITTLVGLIVAIPALVLFNMLQTRVQHIEHQLTMVIDRCLWILHTQFQPRG